LIYPYKVITEKGFKPLAFFYNPNIHPYAEYKKRKESLQILQEKENIPVYYYPDYDIHNYFRAVDNHEQEPQRCIRCWRLRLDKTAKFAKENNFDYFTTTLTVSPYQDLQLIKKVGEEVAEKNRINFYFENFRPGYQKAYQKAKDMGLYHQRYCGCVYSERALHIKKYRKRK
jgi:hypothetical protein